MAKVSKEVSTTVLVAGVAIAALLLFSFNAGIIKIQLDDESIVGQAWTAVTGKAINCGLAQKTTCMQQQNRCATLKGAWQGDCSKCSIKCSLTKKK